MLGDIRLATLANSTVDGSSGATMHDRSVKGNNMTEQGSVLQAAVATDAELQYYTNFGSSNYLSRGYSGNFNFTNTMSVMFWVKDYQHSKDIYGLGTRSSTLSQSIYVDGGYDYRFTLTSDGSTEQQFEIPESETLDEWTFICFSVNAGAVRGYKNGQNVAASNGTFTGNIFSQASANEGLEIGKGAIASTGSSSGKLALFRISATAPTPQQVKDIYEAEAPLFRAGAKCLLQSDSGVSPNGVEDLAFDDSTGLLHVAQRGNTVAESRFRGLEMVESVGHKNGVGSWDYSDISIVAANAGVVASARTLGDNRGVITDLPPFDVRGDTNIADSKLPDDGKIRFTGVTTDATVTTIGQIPVAEGETYMVRAVISGNQYQDQDGERILVTAERTFYRDIGGNILGRSDTMKMTDETTASLDAILSYNTSPPAHNILIKVTGKAGTRMQWNAEVEVQRISEKTYER